MSRSASLGALLVAIAVAGVILPHVVAGEMAGSLPSLGVGMAVAIGCLALGGRSRSGRILGSLGVALVALAPLVGWFAQEAAEQGSELEAVHAEPSLIASIGTQAPLIILALIAVRLLVAAVATVVRVLTRRTTQPSVARAPSVHAPVLADLLPIRLTRLSSNV